MIKKHLHKPIKHVGRLSHVVNQKVNQKKDVSDIATELLALCNHRHIKWIIGIDEVGRGPLAGPVVVAGTCISAKEFIYGLTHQGSGFFQINGSIKDSKQISEKQRVVYSKDIKKDASSWAISHMSAKEIDAKGISVCISQLVPKVIKKILYNTRDIQKCDTKNTLVLLDGSLKAPVEYYQKTFIKGDAQISVIAAASVIAKVYRDNYMAQQSRKKEYSIYGFENHKGYGTKKHIENLKISGPSPLHRKSFIKNFITTKDSECQS
jgi:ribonuclease HII